MRRNKPTTTILIGIAVMNYLLAIVLLALALHSIPLPFQDRLNKTNSPSDNEIRSCREYCKIRDEVKLVGKGYFYSTNGFNAYSGKFKFLTDATSMDEIFTQEGLEGAEEKDPKELSFFSSSELLDWWDIQDSAMTCWHMPRIQRRFYVGLKPTEAGTLVYCRWSD